MERLTYEFEFITPAFIGGAYPEEISELRPSSVVGVLRYWFRVIVGASVNNSQELFKLESQLFGNQKEAGKVWIKVKNPAKEKIKKCESLETCFVKNGRIRKFGKDCGKSYLGYGNILYVDFSRRNIFYKKLKNYCERQGKIKGTFFVKPKITECNSILEILTPKDQKEKVEALLFILSQVGFLGSRGRRGWGNFYLRPKYNGSKFQKWGVWDEEEFVKAIKTLVGKDINSLPFELYKIDRTYPTSLEALESLGRLYREFRFKYNPDYRNIKDFLKSIVAENKYKLNDVKQRIRNEGIKRALLGMPIIFRFSSDESLRNFSGEVKTESGRMASPLLFRIVRLPNKRFSFIFIYLRNFKKPPEIHLIARKNRDILHKFSFSTLKNDIVKEWVDFLRKQGINVGVLKYV